MKRIQRSVVSGAMIGVVALLVALGSGAVIAQAGSQTGAAFTTLTLKNGWTGGPFSTGLPAVAKISGVVVFKGAMANASTANPVAFTLPAGFRPSKAVFVAVDEADANTGRIDIATSGVVTVEAPGGNLAIAKTFTSLDGVSFAP
jgi:hypothetical protein